MIYFRCDVSGKAGWGHFKRCLALAESFRVFTQACFLIPEPDDHIRQLIQNVGAALCPLPKGISYAQELPHYPDGAQNIIVDLGHRKNLDNPQDFLEYLHALDWHDYKIVIMDGLDDDSFRDERAPQVKAYVQPYWGVSENVPPSAEHWLHGAQYVLLDKIYENVYRKRTGDKIQNLLVTFGGADPQENTIRALSGLLDENANPAIKALDITVIIGPSFAETHLQGIEGLAQNKSNVRLVYRPDNLLEYYHWADLCLGGSSTSRYEAVACGVPMIFTAIYPEHKKLSQSFCAYGTAQYIGYYEDIKSAGWHDAVFSLHQTLKAYINMVNAIEKMQQSEFGTEHLVKALLKIFELSQ